MGSLKKHGQPGRRRNELIISDDIDSTESYAGVGQLNILNSNTVKDSSSEVEYAVSKLNINTDKKTKQTDFCNDSKMSPNLEFNFPKKLDVKHNAKRYSEEEKRYPNTHSDRVKHSAKITSLPVLNMKTHTNERDLNDLKGKSINDQIERIEQRKEKLTLSEKKNRMHEIRLKAKQNWSHFKTDIDFITSVENKNFGLTNDSVNIINDEKILNNILNELSSEETQKMDEVISEQSKDLYSEVVGEVHALSDVDNQENLVEFTSTIRHMSKSYPSSPLSADSAMDLKQIIFNSSCRSWGTEWYRQNFEFFPIYSEYPFAMIQKMEGPNSVMAALQAEFLIETIFHCDLSINWLCNLRRNRNQILAKALARIIFRCRPSKTDTVNVCLLDVKLKGRTCGSIKSDGITECIVVYQISNKEDLQQFLMFHISQFVDNLSPGLILLVVSCLLTYGISNILHDIKNDDKRLISPLGIPKDELMNLLITGRLISHYFNDSVQIVDYSGSYLSLQGVPSRSTVGILSAQPHCHYCKEIGTYLKTPKYPVWLSKLRDQNYVILYCLNGSLVNDWKTEIRFQLNLYSPSMAKNGVIKMTIDSSVSVAEKIKMSEEKKEMEKEMEERQKEVTRQRMKNMSESALKFLLHGESVDDYLNNSENTSAQSKNQMNAIEEIIYTKWPNASVLISEEHIDLFLIKH